jgi:hypothetical protein
MLAKITLIYPRVGGGPRLRPAPIPLSGSNPEDYSSGALSSESSSTIALRGIKVFSLTVMSKERPSLTMCARRCAIARPIVTTDRRSAILRIATSSSATSLRTRRNPPGRRSSRPGSLPRLCASGGCVLPLHEYPGALLHRLPERHRDAAAICAGRFAGWFEACLGGRWFTFDPRKNMQRAGTRSGRRSD